MVNQIHIPIKLNSDGQAALKQHIKNESHGEIPTQADNFNEQFHYDNYSIEAAERDYANRVYYKQRPGGDGWFHGRVTNSYRRGYDEINWSKGG